MNRPRVADLLGAALTDLTVRQCRSKAPLWLNSGDDAPLLSVRSISGRPSLWHAERPADIAADLDAAAPLLNRIEQASGWRFEPRSLCHQSPNETLRIDDGSTVVELALGPAHAAPDRLLATAAAVPREASRPFPRMLQLRGPCLPVDEVASLSGGDLLLLPSSLPMHLTGSDESLSLALDTGRLFATRWEPSVSTGMNVTLEIEAGPILLSDDQLRTLENGGELVAGAPAEFGPVSLSFNGRPLGHGRLVRIGSAWAVRLEGAATAEEQES